MIQSIRLALRPGSLIALALLCAACDTATGDNDVPDGLTEGERDRLQAAAERLDARPPAPGAEDASQLEAETRARLAAEQSQQGAAER